MSDSVTGMPVDERFEMRLKHLLTLCPVKGESTDLVSRISNLISGPEARQGLCRSISPVIGTKRTGMTERSSNPSDVLVMTFSSW